MEKFSFVNKFCFVVLNYTCTVFIYRNISLLQMMLHYNLADYKDVNEFLSLLATRLGKLKKGGLPDVDKAARAVLQDWTR